MFHLQKLPTVESGLVALVFAVLGHLKRGHISVNSEEKIIAGLRTGGIRSSNEEVALSTVGFQASSQISSMLLLGDDFGATFVKDAFCTELVKNT
jgi:hypothetical protein